ncbi:hypothetical protein BCR37DRAFT_375926 [Protomyces lactucae-debilis]|uniref:Uncharacterized protein n=1 Tax=Protomyces lactucae-debilis TaxID=2754530 RepID=A0A1Y2FZ90_PROLT|nr:uncharacterized protein BCR37DRAFT_375926 [Protomyces lactucae-debilis]ORY87955.1 hypothetical protein BCR37DRAFT_375926 [Protomyces lactucae-debilis]
MFSKPTSRPLICLTKSWRVCCVRRVKECRDLYKKGTSASLVRQSCFLASKRPQSKSNSSNQFQAFCLLFLTVQTRNASAVPIDIRHGEFACPFDIWKAIRWLSPGR